MRRLSDVRLKDNDRQAIERASDILRAQFPVERVVLFGSKARGDDDPESDIDLLVLTRRSVGQEEKGQMTSAVFDLQLSLNVCISLLVVPLEEWERGVFQVMPIRFEIDREGVAA